MYMFFAYHFVKFGVMFFFCTKEKSVNIET